MFGHARHSTVVLFVAALICLFSLGAMCAVVTPQPGAERRIGQDPPRFRSFVSLFSVCDAEMRLLCADQEESPLKCLLQRLHRARPSGSATAAAKFSDECGSWLRAREKCVSIVRTAGACMPHESASECLRHYPPHRLPGSCRDTAYYENVMLYGELKRHRQRQ